MTDISDLELLVASIRARITCPGSLVAVEGYSTAGKTHLSKALAAACGGASISTDTYVDRERNANTYLDHIVIERLSSDLTKLRQSRAVVFIEGICLRDILRSLAIVPQAFVYSKRVSQAGLWVDDPDNYVEARLPRPDLSWVDRQSVLYHLQARPLEKADIVYAWREE